MTRILLIITIGLAAAAAPAASASAADIELRAQAEAAGAVVTLADIAVITGDDAAAIASLELVPAPTSGRSRSLKAREVQDLLALQGVKLFAHTFRGASNVQIVASGNVQLAVAGNVASTTPAVKATKSAREQILARAERAIQRHLKQVADDRVAWQISVDLQDEQISLLHNRGDIVATGGSEPWTGSQSFMLQVGANQNLVRVPVTARVQLPEMVVVAKRPFRRGEVVQASDVELQMPQAAGNEIALASRIEDVIGRETVRSVATGQPIEAAWVRKPIMVRRGEVVTVFAKASNVVVRTQARAMEDGGREDVIAVERLDNRQRFSARVTGVQELEVFVGGARVTSKAK